MKLLKYISVMTFIVLLSACSKSEDHANHEHNNMNKTMHNDASTADIIDVESIDINKDEKLYECPMDWNIISDKDGSCPSCGMELKEYSVADVKANLDKYGYEYKK